MPTPSPHIVPVASKARHFSLLLDACGHPAARIRRKKIAKHGRRE
jgi:hypothetical protein